MARVARRSGLELLWQTVLARWSGPTMARFRGGLTAACGLGLIVAFASYHATDPSLNAAAAGTPRNLMGGLGADIADLALQSLGLAAWLLALVMIITGLGRASDRDPALSRHRLRRRALIGCLGAAGMAGLLAAPPAPQTWPLARGLGGFWGEGLLGGVTAILAFAHLPAASLVAAVLLGAAGMVALAYATGLRPASLAAVWPWIVKRPHERAAPSSAPGEPRVRRSATARRATADPVIEEAPPAPEAAPAGAPKVKTPRHQAKDSEREQRENQKAFDFVKPGGFHLPELAMLAKPKPRATAFDEEALRQNARMLEGVLAEFGVKGQVDQIRPGPVVTLYELVPAPGVKSARVVALSDDIARSMSVAACRVSVVP